MRKSKQLRNTRFKGFKVRCSYFKQLNDEISFWSKLKWLCITMNFHFMFRLKYSMRLSSVLLVFKISYEWLRFMMKFHFMFCFYFGNYCKNKTSVNVISEYLSFLNLEIFVLKRTIQYFKCLVFNGTNHQLLFENNYISKI